jgi:hypothetical protein
MPRAVSVSCLDTRSKLLHTLIILILLITTTTTVFFGVKAEPKGVPLGQLSPVRVASAKPSGINNVINIHGYAPSTTSHQSPEPHLAGHLIRYNRTKSMRGMGERLPNSVNFVNFVDLKSARKFSIKVTLTRSQSDEGD